MSKFQVKRDSKTISKELEGWIISWIKLETATIPGGQELIADALKDGNITINFCKPVKFLPIARWTSVNRTIHIHYPPDSKLELLIEEDILHKDNKDNFKILTAIQFELCNAANPLLANSKPILSFSNSDDYAHNEEKQEFASVLRSQKLEDAAISLNLWPKEYVLGNHYSENDFESYLNDQKTIDVTFGNSHYDLYIKKYKIEFDSAMRKITSELDTIQRNLYNDFTSHDPYITRKNQYHIEIVRTNLEKTISKIENIKNKTCPEVLRNMGLSGKIDSIENILNKSQELLKSDNTTSPKKLSGLTF